MGIRGGNLEIQPGTAITDKLRPLSLDQAFRRYRNFQGKQTYYVGVDRRGRLFGIVGNSNMFYIPEEVYSAIGMPNEDEKVSAASILEKAGY